MKKILIGLVVLIIVTAGLIGCGNGQTITLTNTPTTKLNQGAITVRELILNANAGKYAQGEKIRVSGILTDIAIEGAYWFVVLGPAEQGIYVLARISVADVSDINYPYPAIEMIVEGDYYGFNKIDGYEGVVLKYCDRIK